MTRATSPAQGELAFAAPARTAQVPMQVVSDAHAAHPVTEHVDAVNTVAESVPPRTADKIAEDLRAASLKLGVGHYERMPIVRALSCLLVTLHEVDHVPEMVAALDPVARAACALAETAITHARPREVTRFAFTPEDFALAKERADARGAA